MRKGTAFRQGKEQRKLLKDVVFEAIQKEEKGVHTNELVFSTGLKIHSLSARLSELEQEGRIYQKGIFCREKQRPFTIWQVTPSELIERRREENWNKRLLLWLNKGKNNGFVTQKELDQLKKQTKIFF